MERHITLLLQNGKDEDLKKIKNWCKENDIEFSYRYSRETAYKSLPADENTLAPLYYFSIFTDTAHYNELKNLMGEKILTTDYADFSNALDCDDTFENKFRNLVELLRKNQNADSNANKKLLDMVMPITDSSHLKEMLNYQCYMTDFQKKILDDRIKILDGNIEEVHEQFIDDIMSAHVDVKELRAKTGMNRREFCRYFDIPYRTVEDWETRKSTCATYLYKLMEDKLKKDNKIQ